ncbi:MAG: AMP-binding protein [Caulobacterales bacterium]
MDVPFLNWSVGALLKDARRQAPDRVALIVPAQEGRAERIWTYKDLLDHAEVCACALLSRFASGDRVATWAVGSPEIIVLQLGAALAGVVLVTLNPANRAVELEYMLDQSGACGIFLSREFRGLDNVATLEQVRAKLPKLTQIIYLDQWTDFIAGAKTVALPDVAAGAPCLILYTSGSTGKPKAAVLTHNGVVNSGALTARRLNIPAGSVWLNLLPMFHVGGSVTMTLSCIANVGTQILQTQFSPDGMLDALDRYKVTVTMAVPTMLIGVMDSPNCGKANLSSLRAMTVGGTAVAPELVRRVKEKMGVEVRALMGQTEASGTMFCTREGDDEFHVTKSVGFPLDLMEARIASTSDGSTLAHNDIGEICIRAAYRMREYFQMPEKTRDAIDADGWLHTGDLGFMYSDGYVQITGRLKEMIIRGGENIYPREIEDVLSEHPDVAQSAVFGLPDEKWGEIVAAAVLPRAGKTPNTEALAAFLQERIARHKVPKVWKVVDAFPLNASGKIQKFILQEQFASEGRI